MLLSETKVKVNGRIYFCFCPLDLYIFCLPSDLLRRSSAVVIEQAQYLHHDYHRLYVFIGLTLVLIFNQLFKLIYLMVSFITLLLHITNRLQLFVGGRGYICNTVLIDWGKGGIYVILFD